MIRMNCSIHALKLVTAIIYLIKPAFYTWCIHRKWNINWRITYKEEPIKQKWYGVAQHISAVVLEGTDNIILTKVILFGVFIIKISLKLFFHKKRDPM